MSAFHETDLAEIPGLGPVRRAALEAAGVRDLQGLLNLKIAELAAVRGVGMWQARRIHEFLRQRGLLVPAGEDGDLVPSCTAEEAAAVVEAMEALEAQGRAEAELEREVAMLAEAAAGAESGAGLDAEADGREPQPVFAGADAGAPEEAEEVEEDEGAGEPSGDASYRDRIRTQREQLPEAALALMEAIRADAVSQQLIRQITRLLITAGEFLGDAHPLTEEQHRRASEGLAQAEQALRRATEKRCFSPREQKDLADRLRRRRKELDRLLDRG